MSQGQSLQALDLIAEDLFKEINLALAALDTFIGDENKQTSLDLTKQHLKKLKGVFSLLEIVAAKQLIIEIVCLVESLAERPKNTQPKILELISTALLKLHRYLEHVQQKNFDIPELLLPIINQLRKVTRRKPLGESAFLTANYNKRRANKEMLPLTSESTASESRHFRQMYQIGLIEVIRQTNVDGGLKMIQKALTKLDDKCARPSSPNLWWLAKVLMHCFIDKSLLLSKDRIKLFSKIDHQIRNIENKNNSLFHNHKIEMDLLSRDLLYLIQLSHTKDSLVASLLKHFDTTFSPVSDSDLRKEFVQLSGPSAQDFNSISDALLQELASIESSLVVARQPDYQAIDLEAAMIQMISLNNMLKILQVDDQAIRLSMAIDLIAKSIEQDETLAEKDINILHLVIEKVRESVDQSELAKYSGNIASKRSQLNMQQKSRREKAHKIIKKLIHMLSEFTLNGKKVLLLKGGDELFAVARQALAELEIDNAVKVLEQCGLFFINHLQKNPKGTSEAQINLFADVIASLEFYLDTMEFTATPSPRILEFAQNSLNELTKLNP